MSKLMKPVIAMAIVCMVLVGMVPSALAYTNSPFLSNISVVNGQLSPAFHANSYEYTLAPDIGFTTVTVTATPDDPAASVTVNGGADKTVTLSLDAGGVRQAVIVVTSADGKLTETYTINLVPRSSDASLSRINVYDDILSPYFNPDVYNYTVTSQHWSYCTVSVTLTDPFASVSINGVNKKDSIRLEPKSASNPDTATIVVTAADGVTTKTYTVKATENSNNADLKSIDLYMGWGRLWPSFSSDVTNYYVTPSSPISFVDLILVPVDKRCSIKMNGSPLSMINSEYKYRIGFSVEAKTAVIEVTASDGLTRKTYTVNFALCRPEITVSPASYNSVQVSWNSVPDASGYELYRSTSETGAYSKIKTITSARTLSYTDTSVVAGTTYYYKVKAYNNSWGSVVYSDYSAPASARPTLSAVASVSAAAYSPTGIKISWSAVSNRSGYEVWRSTSPDSGFTLIKSTTSTSYKNTKLGANTTYYYKVRVYRKVNGVRAYSDFSATVSATPVLGAVASARAAVKSASRIKISWSAVTGRSGYEVWRSAAADGEYVLVKSTTGKNYTNTGLTPNMTYYYKVRAYCTVNGERKYSAFTSPVSATPYFADVTGAKAVRSGATKIKLSWKKVSGRSGYEVWRSDSADGEYTLIKTTKSTSYANAGLTTGKTYYYKVRAYVTVGGVKVYSNYSAIVSATP